MTLPFVSGNQQSWTAAHRAASKSRGTAKAIFDFALLQGSHGVTADEIITVFAVRESTITARIKGLKDSGLLVSTSMTRPTRTGCPAAVFVVPAGADFSSYRESKTRPARKAERELIANTMAAVEKLTTAHRQGSQMEQKQALRNLLRLHGVSQLPLFDS